MPKQPINIADLAGTFTKVAGALGIMYGVITFFVNKNQKLENSASKTELVTVANQIKNSVDSIREQNETILHRQSKNDKSLGSLNGNVLLLRNEFVKHISNDKSLSEKEKIDDILRIVNNISEDVRQKQKEDSYQKRDSFQIKYERITKPKANVTDAQKKD